MHCPRPPTLEPSKGHRPKNRHRSSVPALLFVVVVEDATLPVVANTVEELSSTSVCYGSRCGNHTLVSGSECCLLFCSGPVWYKWNRTEVPRKIRLQVANQQAPW